MPRAFQRYWSGWRTLHPGWGMVTWKDSTLPTLENASAFRRAPTAAIRSNIARYEILLREGGVYVDTDFECLRNLEPLLDGIDGFVAWAEDGVANNAIIGARPGHPFIHDLVMSLEDHILQHHAADAHVVQTGPHFLTTVLRRHPDVATFPSELFYPYAWHERWRRRERFPDAYAVHHWSLTWRSANWPSPRTLGEEAVPCLSVIVTASRGRLLRWVLEGLAVQTVRNFEVFITGGDADRKRIDSAIAAVSDRLNVKRLDGAGLFAGQRVLWLEGDCLPDVDVVEAHARYADAGIVPFGFARAYPQAKYYDYFAPLDYDGLFRHCTDDPRLNAPLFGDWRDVRACSVSAPVSALTVMGDLATMPERTTECARRVAASMFRLRPLWEAGYVTRLGSRDAR
jgi:hypothetical protein